MRVLVCGSRHWTDIVKIRVALMAVRNEIGYDDFLWSDHPHTVIHGAHWQGADKLGDKAAREIGFHVKPYPAKWLRFGLAAGPIRNQQMIDTKPDLVLAFGTGKGTEDCVRRAEKAGIPVRRFE